MYSKCSDAGLIKENRLIHSFILTFTNHVLCLTTWKGDGEEYWEGLVLCWGWIMKNLCATPRELDFYSNLNNIGP